MVLLWCALGVLLVRLVLRQLNLNHLKRHGHRVPAGFEGVIDRETLKKSRDYTLALSRLGLVESLSSQAVVLYFLFGGGLGFYDRWVNTVSTGYLTSGLTFFGGLFVASTLLSLPFNLWRTFVVEERHGFNTTTFRLWCADQFKGLLLTVLFMGTLLAGALALVNALPEWWWLPVWGVLALFVLFVIWISPYVIEPLFFKFTPLQDSELGTGIQTLVEKTGLRVEKIFQVDASRRSGHSNAYFTGIGKDKRIVLFDTLLEQMGHEEILAVLAHELGHWKYGHIRKTLIRTLLISLGACFAGWWCLKRPEVPSLVGLIQASDYARFLILGFAGSLLGFFGIPWSSWRSRKQEWQADGYAGELTGNPGALASALIKLSRENLSNLHPHPLYARFYYSHPPATERVAALSRPD